MNPLFGFGIGPTEIVIVCVVLALLFGPSQLPKMARSFGSAIPSFKKGMAEVNAEVAEIEKGIKA